MSTIAWLARAASNKGVYTHRDGGWGFESYHDLGRRAVAAALDLQAAGVRAGDRVVISLPAGGDVVAALFGVFGAGATATLVAPRRGYVGTAPYGEHVARVLEVTGAGVGIVPPADAGPFTTARPGLRVVEPRFAPAAPQEGEALAEITSEQPLLQMTSGSTGQPKAVRVSAGALESNLETLREWLGGVPEDHDLTASWLPLSHDMGLVGSLLVSVYNGVSIRLMQPTDFMRDPGLWLDCFGLDGATRTAAPPFVLRYVVDAVPEERAERYDFSRWKSLIVGSERLDATTLDHFLSFAVPRGFDEAALLPAYGLAEATLFVSGRATGVGMRTAVTPADGSPPRVDAEFTPTSGRMVSSGRTHGDTSVRIVDDEGTEVAEGSVGRIVIRGGGLADGYELGHGEGTIDFGDELDTGDLGFVVEGELFVLGRAGDGLKIHGLYVLAEGLEAAVMDLGVLEHGFAVVAGETDQAPKVALLVTEDLAPGTSDALLDTLAGHVKGRADVAVVGIDASELTRTTSGKPMRSQMWGRFVAGEIGTTVSTRPAPANRSAAR